MHINKDTDEQMGADMEWMQFIFVSCYRRLVSPHVVAGIHNNMAALMKQYPDVYYNSPTTLCLIHAIMFQDITSTLSPHGSY